MKLTKSYLKQIIAEELLPEGVVRLSSDTDADFRGNMVQLISNTGRLALDKKSMRMLLSLVKNNLGHSYAMRKKGINITEAKRFSLPNGVKVEMDQWKGIVLYGHGSNKVSLDRAKLRQFLIQMQKQTGIR
tara:strand:- start:305 stop:697 length:393 start_codon:yes stop_codon:yes gene_type:complete